MKILTACTWQPASPLRAAVVRFLKDDDSKPNVEDVPVMGVLTTVADVRDRPDDPRRDYVTHDVLIWSDADDAIVNAREYDWDNAQLVVGPASESAEQWQWRLDGAAGLLRDRMKRDAAKAAKGQPAGGMPA